MKDSSRMAAQVAGAARVVGLDLSDRKGTFVELDGNPAGKDMLSHGTVTLTAAGLRARFGDTAPCRIAIEVGTHSPWVSRLLTDLGHQVILANPRQVPLISRSGRKTEPRGRRVSGTPGTHRPGPAPAHPPPQCADAGRLGRDPLPRCAGSQPHRLGQYRPWPGQGLRGPFPAVRRPASLPWRRRPCRRNCGRRCCRCWRPSASSRRKSSTMTRWLPELAKTRYPQTKLLDQVEGVGQR